MEVLVGIRRVERRGGVQDQRLRRGQSLELGAVGAGQHHGREGVVPGGRGWNRDRVGEREGTVREIEPGPLQQGRGTAAGFDRAHLAAAGHVGPGHPVDVVGRQDGPADAAEAAREGDGVFDRDGFTGAVAQSADPAGGHHIEHGEFGVDRGHVAGGVAHFDVVAAGIGELQIVEFGRRGGLAGQFGRAPCAIGS